VSQKKRVDTQHRRSLDGASKHQVTYALNGFKKKTFKKSRK